jgi:NitT/TauT family transport system ATP-binding protein
MSAHIQVRDVTKRFGAMTALDRVALDIGRGEFAAVVGPSGCGKSTLMRIVAGLETPTQGSVTVRRRDAGKPLSTMVFQETSIFPWMTELSGVLVGIGQRPCEMTSWRWAKSRRGSHS